MTRLVLATLVLLLGCGDDEGGEGNASSQDSDEGGGPFACGTMLQCTGDAEYCEVVLAPTGQPLSYHCVALPMECGNAPDCECLVESTCEMCEETPDGGLKSSCVPE